MLLNKSAGVAFSGMLAALCVGLMLCTGLLPVATYALPALSGVLLISAAVELGKGWALSVYAAVSLLSVVLAADKEAVLLFILFFGYYPVVKAVLESLKQRWMGWLLKFLIFNAAMIACFFASIYILGIPEEEFTIYGVYIPWILLLLGNGVFLLYDYAISGIVVFYFQRFHKLFAGWLKRK